MTSIHVQEGQTVAKDDILIELSGDDLTESIQSASETLRSAEISLQNLQDTMANYTVTSPISGTIIERMPRWATRSNPAIPSASSMT